MPCVFPERKPTNKNSCLQDKPHPNSPIADIVGTRLYYLYYYRPIDIIEAEIHAALISQPV